MPLLVLDRPGPYRELPGYDFMIQAQGGIMSITGPADGEPHKVGVAIADITTGLFASNAILAALHHREKTGEGQFVDVALLDSQVAWLANVAQNYFATGEKPGRYGNAHPNLVPYETFPTADETIAVALGSDMQYEKLCRVAERPDLWADERYQTNAGRVTNRVELIGKWREVFEKRPSTHWLTVLKEAVIPVSLVNDVPTVMNDPQVKAREMVQAVPHPQLGEIELLGPVAKLSETPAKIRSAPPELGADTEVILKERLNYSVAEIAQLREKGVI